MGEMRRLDQRGDIKTIWDEENEDEVEAARQQFEDLVGDKDFKAFKVNKKGDATTEIKQFDPSLEKMILVPPVVGG